MTPAAAKKHLEVIKAFAEGKEIQWRFDSGRAWIGHRATDLAFNEDTEYRIKPESIRYRIALLQPLVMSRGTPDKSLYSTMTVNNEIAASNIEHDARFVRWLTDWQEVEV